MADGFKAGTVYIDVEPETRGFYAKVKAMLERLDDQTIHLDADVDMAAARTQLERLQRSGGTIEFDARVNTSAFDKVHKQLAEMASISDIDLTADTDDFDKKVAAAFDTMRRNHAEAVKGIDADSLKEFKAQRSRLRELSDERKRALVEASDYTKRLDKNHATLTKTIERNRDEYARLAAQIEEARGRRDTFKRGTEDFRSASAEVKQLRQAYADLGKTIKGEERTLAKMERDRAKYLKQHERSVKKIETEYKKLSKTVSEGADAFKYAKDNAGRFNNVVRAGNTLIDRNGLSVQRLRRDLEGQTDAFRKASQQVRDHNARQRELSKSLLATEGNVDALRRTLGRVQFVDTKSHVKDLDAMTERVSALQKELLKVRNNPSATLKFKAELEEGTLRADLERLSRDVQVEVRVNAQQMALENLERELSELEHKRVNIPVDLKVDYENAIAERKRLIEQIRKNPELDWEVKSDVDIDEANARRKLRDLQNDYKKLDMDVDLETALARAHLAYFTRPRTVDIFAKFHGTDLGKILSGMTAGATGLQGVQNQFQNLVNLFDRLDKVVPRVALVGTVLSDIAAGAINLAGTVGGLGKSIVSMSKAAYAAPAALTGMGLAYASLRMIIGDKGKAWTENINLAGTALDGLGEKLQDTFYKKAGPAFKEFANQVGNVVGPQMQKLASLEADVFTGMLDMVNASRKVGQLGRVFTHVNDSLRLLTPGVESVVDAFLNLSDAGGTYLAQFSNWISRNMEWFATWSRAVQADSATIDAAMSQVKEQAGYLADSFFALKDIAKGVFGALGQNQNGLERFAANLQKAAHAVNSISFQDTMNAWVTGAQNAQHGMRDAFSQVGQAANIMRQDVASVMSNLGELTGNVFGDVTRLAGRVSPSLSKFSDGVKQGISSISDALADVSPMFGELIEMAGKLSRTFGGTLAATLKAAAPSIEAIAKATGTVADAFNKLPDPIKGALGLWVTFGKAGSTALTALKTGMLDNIQKTLSYRRTLADLGLSAGDAGISFGRLVQAQVKMRSGNIAGVLSDSAKGMSGLSSAAKDAAPGILAVGTNMAKSTGKLSGVANGLKTAGSALLGAVGGLPGIAVSAGLTAVVTAFSSYSQHVSQAREVQEGFNEAARATPGALAAQAKTLRDYPKQLDNFAVKAKDGFEASRSFWDNLNPTKTNFASAAEALKDVGMNVDDVAKATVSGRDAFGKYGKTLSGIINKNTELYNQSDGDAAKAYKKQADAAQLVLDKMNDYRQQALTSLKAKAADVGKTAEWVDQMDEAKQSLTSISEGLLSETEQSERLVSVKGALAQMTKQQQSAWIQAQSAGSSYYKTLDQMPEALSEVKAQVDAGNSAWKGLAEGFDLTSEYGRTASDAMNALASNTTAYIDAMIARGDSWDTINGKYGELRKNLEEQARAAGVAEGDIKAYVDTLMGTPEEVKTRVELTADQAKLNLISLVEQMQYLFPDGSRDEQKQLVIDAITNGKMDVASLNRLLLEMADKKHEVVIDASTGNVVAVLRGVESQLKGISDETWNAYVKARAEGKDDVEALKKALETTPEARDAFIKAHEEGKDDVEALKIAIDEVNSKKIKVEADTDGVPEKIAALQFDIERVSNSSGIKIDADIDPAIRKIAEINGWAVDDKTGEIYLNDDQYAEALKYVDGIKLDPKTGELIAEDNEYTKKLAEVNGWTIEDKTGRIILEDGQALSVSKELQALLGSMDGKVWKTFISALVSGQSEVDALKTALNTVPEYKDAFLEAHQKGMNDVDALKYAIEKVTGKKVEIDADTDPANAKMSAYINEPTDAKTIQADMALGPADSQLSAWAAVSVKKPVETEVEQPSLIGTIASITSLITSTLIPPAKVRVEGDDTDARTKIGAMQAFGGQTLASMLALILGDDTQARNAIGGVSAFNGRTIANPWARVLGEHNLASAAIRAIGSFNGRTIANPWARVMGENVMARAAIMAIKMFNGLTISKPWARVEGDDSGANAVIRAIASTNGSVIATRYVDIVTRGSGSVKAATGGRIHGPGTGTSDSIPAMLSNNEHVIRAYATAKLDREVGPNFLNVLNQTGDLSKALANANSHYLDSARSLARGAYATGGRVKTMFSGATNVHVDGGKTVNQTFNLQTKVVRSDQDLHAAAQIDRAALMRTARREARL